MNTPDFENALASRLLALAADVTSRGVAPDVTVRAMLSAAFVFAQRYDSAASISAQLQPVLDAMSDDDAGPVRPLVQ